MIGVLAGWPLCMALFQLSVGGRPAAWTTLVGKRGNLVSEEINCTKTRKIRIVDSHINDIEEDAFLSQPSASNARLEVINTTVRRWFSNDMSSFQRITISGSTIHELHAGAINHSRREANNCDLFARIEQTNITFIRSTIRELHGEAIIWRSGSGQVQIEESTINVTANHSMSLSSKIQLQVRNSVFGTLEPGAFGSVCSDQPLFISNRISLVPPGSLGFGSARCRRRCPDSHRISSFTIHGNTLPCGPQLLWLRDALAGGRLPNRTRSQYELFRNTSACADSADRVPVARFLGDDDVATTSASGARRAWTTPLIAGTAAGALAAAAAAAVVVVVVVVAVGRRRRRRRREAERWAPPPDWPPKPRPPSTCGNVQAQVIQRLRQEGIAVGGAGPTEGRYQRGDGFGGTTGAPSLREGSH